MGRMAATVRTARVAVLLAALATFTLACLFGPGGLLTSWHAPDVGYYAQLGRRMVAGQIPYRTLYVEYPPGALPIFLLPAVSQSHYVELFKVLMAICGALTLGVVAWTAALQRRSPAGTALALTPVAVAPVVLGSVFLNRYDPWPALLAALGLALLLAGRSRGAAAALALSALAKIFAIAAVPIAAASTLRRRGRASLRRAVIAFAAVLAVVLVPFAALGPGGLRFSFTVQLTRHLEVESLGASLLLAADRLGLYHATIVSGTPGSRDLAGALPTAVGVLSTLLELAAIVVVWLVYVRGRDEPGRLVAAFAAAVVAYVAFGKVLSPQYVVWLLPLVPLVRGRRGLVATGLLLGAMALTRIEFARFGSLNHVGPVVWVLLARYAVLVGLFALLVARLAPVPLARRREVDVEPVRAHESIAEP